MKKLQLKQNINSININQNINQANYYAEILHTITSVTEKAIKLLTNQTNLPDAADLNCLYFLITKKSN